MSDYNIVLASASGSRAMLLNKAGINIDIRPADIDETPIKNDCWRANVDVATTAATIARTKAEKVSVQLPKAYVIGADQMLDCGGRWFDKPTNIAEAADTLRLLRGTVHELVTSASIVRAGEEVWCHTDRARLVMREFSNAFLESYLEYIGENAFSSVGAYQLESLGVQLFECIEGDYFTILGLPLLPVLKFLRAEGAVGA